MADKNPPQLFIHPDVALARQVYASRVNDRAYESVRQLLEELANEVMLLSREQHPWVSVLLKNWSPRHAHWDSDRLKTVSLDLEEALLCVAREHGFANWQAVVENEHDHLDPHFESAVDAIITGNATGLESLLAASPQLCQRRSPFGHRATLLHYVAANGVETRRQISPANIGQIIKMLVEHGADPNSTCDTYEGGPAQTPLCLAISSSHPIEAHTIGDLVRSLCDGGALVDGVQEDGLPMAVATAFGNVAALEQLAMQGARIDHPLTAAACGELDLLQQYFLGQLAFSEAPPNFPSEYRAAGNDFQSCLDRIRRVALRFGHTFISKYIDEIRLIFSEVLDRFDETLAVGEAVDIAAYVPPDWTGLLRKNLLADICAIDMDYRWRQSVGQTLSDAKTSAEDGGVEADLTLGLATQASRVQVSDYLNRFPELGPSDAIPTQLLLEEFRIRTESGELISVDEFLSMYPAHSEILRPRLQEMAADQEQLKSGVFLHVYYRQQLVYREELTRPLILGRQRQSEPGAYTRIEDDEGDRLIIASLRDRYVSRKHIRLHLLPTGRIRIENCSQKNAISIHSLSTLLLPGQLMECSLPVTFDVESRTLVVQRTVETDHAANE